MRVAGAAMAGSVRLAQLDTVEGQGRPVEADVKARLARAALARIPFLNPNLLMRPSQKDPACRLLSNPVFFFPI